MAEPTPKVATSTISEHGTRARYASRLQPCRCAACTRANAEYEHARRIRARARGVQLTIYDAAGV